MRGEAGRGANLQHRRTARGATVRGSKGGRGAAFCLKWSIGSVFPAHTVQVLILWMGWWKGEMQVKPLTVMPLGNKEP